MVLSTAAARWRMIRRLTSVALAVSALVVGALIVGIARGEVGHTPETVMEACGHTFIASACLLLFVTGVELVCRWVDRALGGRTAAGCVTATKRGVHISVAGAAVFVAYLGILWYPIWGLGQLDRAGSRAASAIADGDVAVLGAILDDYPSLINWQGGTLSRALLLTAVAERQHAAAVFLLARGSDPNVPEKGSRQTALHLAIFREDLEMIALLLKHGADPTRGPVGYSACDLLTRPGKDDFSAAAIRMMESYCR